MLDPIESEVQDEFTEAQAEEISKEQVEEASEEQAEETSDQPAPGGAASTQEDAQASEDPMAEAPDGVQDGIDEGQESAQESGTAAEAANTMSEDEELAVDDEAAAEGKPAAEEEPSTGPGAELSDDELAQRVAALLFASPEPISVARLVQVLERPETPRVKAALDDIGRRLDEAGLPLQVRAIAGGWTILSAPQMGETIARLAKGRKIEKVSAAALETLAVVAYRQPVTKAEIEAIRGVQAGPILRSLVDRGLVRVVGRAEQPGHPLQYGTTREFLDRFGLMSIKELPRDIELAKD